MKTTFLKIAIVLLMVTAGNKTFAATIVASPVFTSLPQLTNFYKIEAHGNVEVHLISGNKNSVEIAGTYYNHNALVQVENGVLRVTSYCVNRLNIWITVSDLSALFAYDNVLVKTEGKFSVMDFDLELFNKAKADVNLDCCFTHIKLNNSAMANISGTAMESDLAVNYAATLNSTNFIAGQMIENRMAPIWEMRLAFVRPAGAELLAGLVDDGQHATADFKELRFSSASTKQVKFDIPAGVAYMEIIRSLIN